MGQRCIENLCYSPCRYVEADSHVHSNFSPCAHRASSIVNIVKACEERKIELVAITDHYHRDTDKDEFLKHVEYARHIGKNTGIEVFSGVEADVFDEDGTLSVPREVTDCVDLVVASLHHIPGTMVEWGHSRELIENHLERHDFQSIADKMLRTLICVAQREDVDIIGHPFRMFGLTNGIHCREDIPQELWMMFLKHLKENSKIFEVNVSDLAVHCAGFRDVYLSFIRDVVSFGIRICFGSDAHHPDGIGIDNKWVKLAAGAVKSGT